MRIYISGQITGLNLEVATKLFKDAQVKLEAKGHEVINPMDLPHKHGQTWREFMLEDIDALMGCQGIYMLENWRDSKGARIEHNIAVEMGLKIFYEIC